MTKDSKEIKCEQDYYEDIEVGSIYKAPCPHSVTQEEIIEFASVWDSREFHVDPEAAQYSAFGGIVASGTHIFSISSKLSLAAQRANRPQATIAGAGCKIRLAHPVRPGDSLFYQGEVTGKRRSNKRDDAGIIETKHQLHNQDDILVFQADSVALVSYRNS